MTIEKLLELVINYDPKELEMVKKTYEYAAYLHEGQYRQSGEPYISHPLNVAAILAEMHADADTICAALLHDTIEDRSDQTSKEEIARLFNPSVATLVDGVTKISKMNLTSKTARNLADTRKIITSLTLDARIVIIKLADRLHNMRTLQYKTEIKQKENAKETLDIFSPLAYYLGTYRIKSELEDLSMKYLYPEDYKELQEVMKNIQEESKDCIEEMYGNIQNCLLLREIPNEIKIRFKNVYRIYKQLKENSNIGTIHDLIAFKILLPDVDQCYLMLRPIHELYKPVHGKMRDFICNPKTNMYQSLHTTVFAPDERLVQMQLRTFDMDKIASFGLTAYWDINKGNAREVMQEDLKNKFQFYKSLLEIDDMFRDNQDFVSQAKKELLSDKVYVYTTKGEVIELPKGATVIDFVYQMYPELGNSMTSVLVNDNLVPFDYILQNKDRVKILTNQLFYGPKLEWEPLATTTIAKRKIRECNHQNHIK